MYYDVHCSREGRIQFANTLELLRLPSKNDLSFKDMIKAVLTFGRESMRDREMILYLWNVLDVTI